MARVGIVSPAILPHDATGRDILHMRRILRARGHEVGLFSTTWGKPQPCDERGVHVLEFLAGDASAVLILHHAIGWQHALPVMAAAKCRRVVKYHNITPARFYENLDPEAAALCRLGREQLRALIDLQCDLYLADSSFNLQEMLEAGADPRRCAIVHPFNDLDTLLHVESDAEVLRDYGDGRTNVLFVGRRAPNKGHRFLLDAFAAYRRGRNADSRLVLVGKGDERQKKYTLSLRHQIWRLGLHGHVVFLESATEAELKAHYECAAAFLIASEHEGFCVPVVEAMAMGVPIVGHGTTAVTQTVGDAGLLWDNNDPYLLAQSLDTAVGDTTARRTLMERGWRRYRQLFHNDRIEGAFLEALRPLAI
jgi:glycosyltransferase involved in cell wall biosynthesis